MKLAEDEFRARGNGVRKDETIGLLFEGANVRLPENLEIPVYGRSW